MENIIRHKASYRGDDSQLINFPPDEWQNDKFNLNKPPELDYNQLFVYVDFFKPGKLHFVVTYENSHVLRQHLYKLSKSELVAYWKNLIKNFRK